MLNCVKKKKTCKNSIIDFLYGTYQTFPISGKTVRFDLWKVIIVSRENK